MNRKKAAMAMGLPLAAMLMTGCHVTATLVPIDGGAAIQVEFSSNGTPPAPYSSWPAYAASEGYEITGYTTS